VEGVECKGSTTSATKSEEERGAPSRLAFAREERGKKGERKNISVGRRVAKRRGRIEQLFHDDHEGKWEGRATSPIPRRELRGSGARGYIIKKQETSSFSPALVKILNGDFMLPVCSSRAPRRHAREDFRFVFRRDARIHAQEACGSR